jgi:hypothetical protein
MATTEPGHGLLRASHADRERAIDVLKAAFAEGRLDQDEYTDRAGRVHASRTYADLGALVADLPVGPLGALAPAPPLAAVPAAPGVLPPPPAGSVPAAASKPRTPMSALEIAVLAILVLVVPALAVPVVIGAACIRMARAGSPSPPRARLAAMVSLIAVIGGLALLLHV